jgi:hypothetical protein
MITAGRQRRQQVLQPNGVVSTVKAREGKKTARLSVLSEGMTSHFPARAGE